MVVRAEGTHRCCTLHAPLEWKPGLWFIMRYEDGVGEISTHESLMNLPEGMLDLIKQELARIEKYHDDATAEDFEEMRRDMFDEEVPGNE